MNQTIEDIMVLYDRYDHFVSGKINKSNAWDIIKEIESIYHVDDIRLKDGTRIWNLLRIFIYTFNYELASTRRSMLLSLSKLFSVRVRLENEDVLQDLIYYIHLMTMVDEDVLNIMVYDYIWVFVLLKRYYHFKYKIKKPDAVIIGCGYGRKPMAKAQACRELGVKCIEEQHGIIDNYLPAYRRVSSTKNHDCVPGYLHTYDDVFTRMVQDGNLFDPDKVITTGYHQIKKHVLVTSQWILADEIRDFFDEVADLMDNERYTILFKPHPFDTHDYRELSKKVTIVDKKKDIYQLMRSVDFHTTVFSSSGLDAMFYGVTTIFIDVCGVVDVASPYVVRTPEEFVKALEVLK